MKLVYLFELDSVKKNDDQVEAGQKALYNEIVNNGNCVVLTMNQIVDSRTILSMMYDTKQAHILEYLFNNGFLKYSRYSDYRTPSQYLQRAIKENRNFNYSALPIRSNQKKILKIVYNALKYDDLSEIEDLYQGLQQSDEPLQILNEGIEDKNHFIRKEEGEKILKHLKVLLKFILNISISNESYLPPIKYNNKYPNFSFIQFMDLIQTFNFNLDGFIEAIEILKQIKETLNDNTLKLNSRSEWLSALHKLNKVDISESEKTILCLSECIINLCHNYTLEYSIYGVSKHYEIDSLTDSSNFSFMDDFFQRLILEWDNGKDKDSRYLQKETNQFSWFVSHDKNLPDWNLVYRLLEHKYNFKRQKNRKIKYFIEEKSILFNIYFKKYFLNEAHTKIDLYENEYHMIRLYHKILNLLMIAKYFIVSILSIVLIYLYFCIEDWLSLNVESWAKIFNHWLMESILVFILLGIFGSIISKIFQISDILDLLTNVIKSTKDFFSIFIKKFTSYVNKKELKNGTRYSDKQLSDNQQIINDNLREYQTLWSSRKIKFLPPDKLPILAPSKENLKAYIDYEINNNIKLGVVYKSDYNVHIVDLIEKKDNKNEIVKYHPYERILPNEVGAVVAVAKCKGNFILLKQFRHSIRKDQYTFVRGFGEPNITPEQNVIKELKEEIGAIDIQKPKFLGKIVADSGLYGNEVSVFTVEIDSFDFSLKREGIKEILLCSSQELETYISNKKINDGYTLSAYMLYRTTA